jgi:hypothetical protein
MPFRAMRIESVKINQPRVCPGFRYIISRAIQYKSANNLKKEKERERERERERDHGLL